MSATQQFLDTSDFVERYAWSGVFGLGLVSVSVVRIIVWDVSDAFTRTIRLWTQMEISTPLGSSTSGPDIDGEVA